MWEIWSHCVKLYTFLICLNVYLKNKSFKHASNSAHENHSRHHVDLLYPCLWLYIKPSDVSDLTL